MTCIKFDVPIKAPSLTNQREHFRARHARTDAQRRATRTRWPGWDGGPLVVFRLTRVAPRGLDSDNLAAALKSVRDELCACLRIDDATPLVRWEYRQEQGPERVRVELHWGEAPGALLGQLLHRLTAQGDALLAAEPRVVEALPAGQTDASGPPAVVRAERRPKSPADVRALATPATYSARRKGT